MDQKNESPSGAPDSTVQSQEDGRDRRGFLTAGWVTMGLGLAGGYGAFGGMLCRFAYPTGSGNRGWLFVCQVDQLAQGDAMDFTAPSGQKIVVARQGSGTTEGDFLALSSVCPHLGCRVHWEAVNERFFCPCHNGAFDRSGVATAGPPAAAHQSLTRFPLRVENGLLFIEAPLTSVVSHEPRIEESADPESDRSDPPFPSSPSTGVS